MATTANAARSDSDGSTAPSLLARYSLTKWDAGALLACCLLVVAFAPPLMFHSWTPRMVLLLAVGPLGLYVLVRLCREGDTAAILLATALLWAVLSAVLSDGRRSAIVGFAGRDLSVLTVTLSAGFWAMARCTTSRGRDLLVPTLTCSVTCGAFLGVLQVLADVTTGPLAMLGGRPTGFWTNPVYYGAICAATLAVAVDRCAMGRWRAYLLPLAIAGIAVSLSGSRVALAATIATATAYVAMRRSRSSLIAAGAALGSLTAGVILDRVAGMGNNAAARLDEGADGRSTVWHYGLEAWLERPFTGHGLGRFRPAVQGRFSLEFVRDYAPDEASQPWFDAHNVVIGLLVAVGIVGTMLFAAWAITWGWRIKGPLVWALIPLVLHWMLQPVSLFTLPLAMLIFGAAGAEKHFPAPQPSRAIGGALVGVGLALGTSLLVADLALRRAADDLDGGRAASVSRFFLNDSIVDDVVAQIYVFDPDVSDRPSTVLRWRQQVAHDEPDRPHWWSSLADHQVTVGDLNAAERSIERAYELQRSNTRTIRAEAALAVALRDEPRLADALARLCALGEPECGLTARALLDRVDELLAQDG